MSKSNFDTATLMHRLEFDAEDLAANRQGVLSERQRAILKHELKWSLSGNWLAMMTVVAIVGVIGLLLAINGSPLISVSYFIFLIVIAFLFYPVAKLGSQN